MQRGKRTGIDPRKMRKEVTAIFHASKTAKKFIAALDKAGYALTLGRKNQFVLVDKCGDTHGLMRRIEGKRLVDLKKQFPGLSKVQLELHDDLVKARKSGVKETGTQRETIDLQKIIKDVSSAYRNSKTGVELFARLNRKEYSLGRGLKGFTVIDKNGGKHDILQLLGQEAAEGLTDKFLDLAAIQPRPASEIIRRIRASASGRRAKAKYAKRKGKYGGRLKAGSSLGRTSKIRPVTAKPIKGAGGCAGAGSSGAPSFAKHNDVLKSYFRQTGLSLAKWQNPKPVIPASHRKGWPEQAVIDWETWGKRAPAKFFAKWPELAPPGFVPFPAPNR
jgi:hypothetical protein